MEQLIHAGDMLKQDKTESQHCMPSAWKRWDVLLASLIINLTTLALPIVILQVYDRILPNQAVDTFSLLIFGLLIAAIFDGVLRVLRSAILTWKGVQYEHKEGIFAIEKVLNSDLVKFGGDSIGSYLDKMESLKKSLQILNENSNKFLNLDSDDLKSIHDVLNEIDKWFEIRTQAGVFPLIMWIDQEDGLDHPGTTNQPNGCPGWQAKQDSIHDKKDPAQLAQHSSTSFCGRC